MSFTLEEILTMVDDTFDMIQKHRSDPTNLLIDANRLSTIMYNIAPLYVDAKGEADASEIDYKDAVNESYLSYKKQEYTETESIARAKQENKDMLKKQLEKSKLTLRLALLRQDIDRKVSVIQSYARELTSQRMQRP